MTPTLITRCDACDRDAGTNPIIGRHGLYCSRSCEAEDAALTAAERARPKCVDCGQPSAWRLCTRCTVERYGLEP